MGTKIIEGIAEPIQELQKTRFYFGRVYKLDSIVVNDADVTVVQLSDPNGIYHRLTAKVNVSFEYPDLHSATKTAIFRDLKDVLENKMNIRSPTITNTRGWGFTCSVNASGKKTFNI